MRNLAATIVLIAVPALAQDDPVSRSWNQPVEPFRIAGNVYYVGASDITSYLIVTAKGHILLDGGFKETAPMIRANIEKLGFKPNDVKLLLSSHAHYDHAGGLAELKRETGAKLYASAGDTPLLVRGGADDPNFGDKFLFPPVEPDHIVTDGERVTVDGTTLVAHITAGHTPGCTTWTMNVREAGSTHGVVFFCSPSVPQGYRLVNNPRYPNIVDDYRNEFRTLKSLDCDVFLAAHGNFFSLEEKRKRLGRKANPFIDSEGCRAFISRMEKSFEAALARESP